MIKVGKKNEYKVNENYKVIIGTSDSEINETLYFTIGSWCQPLLNSMDYNRVVLNLNKRIKKHIYFNINSELFKIDRTIVDLNMRTSGLTLGGKYYISCEVTLFKKSNNKYYNQTMICEVKRLLKDLIGSVFENTNEFKFNKTKK